MAAEVAISVRGLVRKFADVTAIDGLTFDVHYGEIFGLVGPDGAGKTTAMRILAGVMVADSGDVSVAGFDVLREPEGVKQRISYMAQRFGLYEDLSVEENIRFYAGIFGVHPKERWERSERLLDAAGMAPFRTRLAGKLSGGMKQKLGLICALIHTPRVLLLDEPTNGVDPVSRRDFWKILYSLLDEGVAILISTAYLDEAERCHRVALVDHGQLLFCDRPESLKERLNNQVVAVITSEPRRAREAVAQIPGVRNTVLVGDGMHLLVNDAGQMLPALLQAMAAAGVPVASAHPIPASLEDVFVGAVQGHPEAGNGQ